MTCPTQFTLLIALLLSSSVLGLRKPPESHGAGTESHHATNGVKAAPAAHHATPGNPHHAAGTHPAGFAAQKLPGTKAASAPHAGAGHAAGAYLSGAKTAAAAHSSNEKAHAGPSAPSKARHPASASHGASASHAGTGASKFPGMQTLVPSRGRHPGITTLTQSGNKMAVKRSHSAPAAGSKPKLHRRTVVVGNQDLAMVDILGSFGNTIAGAAGMTQRNDSMANLKAGGRTGTQRREPWGRYNKDLQARSLQTQCPWYRTPQKYWPLTLVRKYFSNKISFAVLRDPYERLVSIFRASPEGLGSNGKKYLKSCDVNGAIKAALREYTFWNNQFAFSCQFLPQAEYFDGPFGITLPIDSRKFPWSVNRALEAHNYTNPIKVEDIVGPEACPNIWAKDLDDETKALVRKVYARDFDLLCKHFDHCDRTENVCLNWVQGNCPHRSSLKLSRESAPATPPLASLRRRKHYNASNVAVKGHRDVTMVHIPYSFGASIAQLALTADREKLNRMTYLTDSQGRVLPRRPLTWPEITEIGRPWSAEVWGYLHPDLQGKSNITKCHMYWTPPKYWPEDLAKAYVNKRRPFALLRDPFERLVTMFRGDVKAWGDAAEQYHKKCDVNNGIKVALKWYLTQNNTFARDCMFLPQSEYLDGAYGVKDWIDARKFPDSMNKYFAEHGYPDLELDDDSILAETRCPWSWAGDLDSETRGLVRTVYKRDFELLCSVFHHCNQKDNVCLDGVAGGCPPRTKLARQGSMY